MQFYARFYGVRYVLCIRVFFLEQFPKYYIYIKSRIYTLYLQRKYMNDKVYNIQNKAKQLQQQTDTAAY